MTNCIFTNRDMWRQVRHSTLCIIIVLKMKYLNRYVSFVDINDKCLYKYQRMSKGVIYFVYQEESLNVKNILPSIVYLDDQGTPCQNKKYFIITRKFILECI